MVVRVTYFSIDIYVKNNTKKKTELQNIQVNTYLLKNAQVLQLCS